MHNLAQLNLLLLGILTSSVISSPTASTLFLEKTATIFSLNIANDSNDIYFHFETDAHHTWAAVGAGREMKNALMFMIYPSKDSQHITFSPRIATIETDVLDGTGIQNNKMVLNAVCHNCRSRIDYESPTAHWMYAFGPTGNPTTSDSLEADLTQHDYYGRFTMDMLQATGSGGIPTVETKMSGATLIDHQMVKDGDFLSQTHGWTMAALVVLLAPIVVLHVTYGAHFHWISHMVFGVVLVVGLATGCYDSTYYNRSKHFNSTHQAIGFTALGCFILLIPLRIIFKRQKRTENIYAQPMLNGVGLATLAWVLALVNGFLGIRLASSKNQIYIAYGCSLIGTILLFAVLFYLILRRRKTEQQTKESNEARAIPLR